MKLYGLRRINKNQNGFTLVEMAIVVAIAGLIGEIEYKYNIFVDFKPLTLSGTRGIDYIRKYINPYFIHEAIDNGTFYGRE